MNTSSKESKTASASSPAVNRRLRSVKVGQEVLYCLHVGRCAGEYRPAKVQRAYDDGTADLVVFSRKADEIDTTDNSFDVSRCKVFEGPCGKGDACAIENTDWLKPVVTRKPEPPKPAAPVVPVEEAPLAFVDEELVREDDGE